MNKQELAAMVAEILSQMEQAANVPAPEVQQGVPEDRRAAPEEWVEDISQLDLRRLYLVEGAKNEAEYRRLKDHTPARLGSGRAGARYKTKTMLRFRADHAAAQDTVFAQVPENFARDHGMVEVKTCCRSKDEYLTRPDLGRRFDEENQAAIRAALPGDAAVQLVIGDGLSSAAIVANAMDCAAAIQDGLKLRGIQTAPPLFVRYCRVGAGDAVGDVTGCQLVCVLVGERPGLVTDKSMSAYLTYRPHTGVLESARTVVSNIHDHGTPAVEAGAHIAELIGTILEKKVSGVALQEAVG